MLFKIYLILKLFIGIQFWNVRLLVGRSSFYPGNFTNSGQRASDLMGIETEFTKGLPVIRRYHCFLGVDII